MTFKSTPKDMLIGTLILLIAIAFIVAAASTFVLLTKVEIRFVFKYLK